MREASVRPDECRHSVPDEQFRAEVPSHAASAISSCLSRSDPAVETSTCLGPSLSPSRSSRPKSSRFGNVQPLKFLFQAKVSRAPPFAHGMTALLAHLVTWSASAASYGWHAARAAAGLPATCRQAAAHAALVCSGMDPVYFSAGFAPLSLAWGWLLLGLLLGALLRPYIATCTLALLQLAPPTRALMARAPLQPADARANAAVEVLRCVALGGHDELRALATGAGLTPAALAEALALSSAASAAAMPSHPRRRNRPQ